MNYSQLVNLIREINETYNQGGKETIALNDEHDGLFDDDVDPELRGDAGERGRGIRTIKYDTAKDALVVTYTDGTTEEIVRGFSVISRPLTRGGGGSSANLETVTKNGNETTQGIRFTNGTNPDHQEGLVFYDNGKRALSYYNEESETTINLAQEVVARVINDNGTTIVNGTAVQVDSSTTGLPTIKRSIANTVSSAAVNGVATHNIGVSDTGYVTLFGSVGGLDTSAFSEGDPLYLSSTVAGELVNVKPAIVTLVAFVLVSDATDGSIFVSPQSVEDPIALGQSLTDSTPFVQSLTTTPSPLVGYGNTSFSRNVTVTNTPSSTSFRAIMSPAAVSFSGFYEVSYSISLGDAAGNNVIRIEVYVNSVATGVFAKIDLSNNQIDDGSASLTAITQSIVSETDTIELYIYTEAGSTSAIISNIVFNVKRLGTV